MARNKTLYEITKFYFEKKFPVHITLKSDNWLNGIVTILEKDRLILDEEKFGEMIILFDRIKDDGIKPREEKR